MKKWNKKYFHYPRVPKLQKTSFWSQEILGVNMEYNNLCCLSKVVVVEGGRGVNSTWAVGR